MIESGWYCLGCGCAVNLPEWWYCNAQWHFYGSSPRGWSHGQDACREWRNDTSCYEDHAYFNVRQSY